ncbi:DUF551 domain-containing protein [Escherichia coli]|uniref:DUF551 domain-containing protein n=1 Tax=Escherichia coli TaxID=562 RepID=UPI001933D340|nr:DUF551 domain-containing protein [Escherichia coli]EFN3688663.1 DUF551 domain-containing protein [Escherichia coli]EHK9591876.1 DUF551 domain-containing protein [Escherichia coli]EIG0457559.1 DUF551 domain-containing protein [Escherichia coli]EIG0610996.1 DUF551 domain-containing protein [Escherichia coli]MBM0537962.1 DUF551 domain-containing protein [Escherichia coli]
MAELTKEWLKQTIAEYEANRDELPFGLDTNSAIGLQAFKLALASLEAEPVAYIFKHPAGKLFWALTDESNKEQSDVIPVYADSPAPVVPDEIDVNDVPRAVTYFKTHRDCYADGWNACRAAMLQAEPVSNSDELPLDYLQGHKDGLEWAAQLAEANHPQTGDWLYDDPIDLARAIRKGPDMPTVQAGNYPVTPDGWISCSERMPAQDDWILIYSKHGEYMAGQVQGEYVELSDGTLSWLGNALYWMPLPEPPQEVN